MIEDAGRDSDESMGGDADEDTGTGMGEGMGMGVSMSEDVSEP